MIVVLGFILVYDIYLLVRGGAHNTISWMVWGWSKEFPIIPFLFGLTMGHFFWSQGC
jgi:hypothetical protein